MRQLQIGCGWCGKWHSVKSLAKEVYCCLTSKGVRALVVEVQEGKVGQRYFTCTEGTRIRIVTKGADPKDSSAGYPAPSPHPKKRKS